MRKYALPLAILCLINLAAVPASQPAEETPWGLIKQAAALPATNSPRTVDERYLKYEPYPPYPKKWWELAFDSEQQNTAQFRLLHESRLLMQSNGNQAGIPTPAISPLSISKILPSLNGVRNLANITSDAATFSHLNGNDPESLSRLMDLMNIGNSLSQCHLLLTQLVAIGIEAVGNQTIEIIAPTLRLGLPEAANTRHETAQLIAWLLNEAPFEQAWRDSFSHELRSDEHPSADLGPGAAAIAIKPADAERDIGLLNQACDFLSLEKSLALVNQCTWPAAGFASMDRVFTTGFRILADRRMAAIDLAFQLYRADHHGEFPKSLHELVPTYLPSVPRDPFSSTNAPIGYKILPHAWPNGADRPVLFVDAGPDLNLDAEPRLGWYNYKKQDARQYRDLTLPTH